MMLLFSVSFKTIEIIVYNELAVERMLVNIQILSKSLFYQMMQSLL